MSHDWSDMLIAIPELQPDFVYFSLCIKSF